MRNEPEPTSDAETAERDESDEFDLTPEQEDALVLDRNVAITAGAGTGKTTTLTNRYLELLEEQSDVGPEDIVTITFTRKAATELHTEVREAIYDRLDEAETADDYDRWRGILDELDDGYIHTIHAFCARLLREYGVEAPVPLGFDVLDEEDAAELQHEVVHEFLKNNQANEDVQLLSRLWGHGQLVSILTGLLDERPDSIDWVTHWRDGTVDEYLSLLRTEVAEFDSETGRDFLMSSEVVEARATVNRLATTDLEIDDDVAGNQLLDRLATALEDLPSDLVEADESVVQATVCRLYEALETSSGGLYSSASYHVLGTKADWEEETDAYSDLKTAVNALLDALDPHSDAIKTIPGPVERNSAHYVLALARVFDDVLTAYTETKDEQNALDFPDLIETAIEFLETATAVRDDIQSSFAAVMVDEFQDTDPRQWHLVKLLTGVEDDADNVFLVGDEKQSIYAFRGADVTTFGTARAELCDTNARHDRDTVPGSKGVRPTELELSGNFRTLDTPLTFINELFDELFQPEGEEHASYEARPQSLSFDRPRVEDVEDLDGSVEYMVVPTSDEVAAGLLDEDHPVTEAAAEHTHEAEARALAARLSQLFADPPEVQDRDDGEIRAATPEDVAVLLRRRTHLDRYTRALDDQGISYTVIGGDGFYDTPEVQTLINLLRVLADPGDDISLYGVLRSPLFGFRDDRLAPVAANADSLWAALETTDDPQLADAYQCLSTWRTLAGCTGESDVEILPWGRLLTRIIDETGYLMSVGADERGEQAVANVEKFRNQVRAWGENGIQTAASLLHRIDRQAELDPREGHAEIPDGTDGVRIMTIHAAKGLEFPIVAVPDIGSRLNYGRSIDDYGHVRLANENDDIAPLLAVKGPSPDDPYELESTVAHTYADAQSLPRERAEAKRLLYVACTRVRDHLLLCGTHDIRGDAEEGYVFGDTNAFDEAGRWRDWLQPRLLEQDDVLETLRTDTTTDRTLGQATFTVRLPPTPTQFDSGPDGTTSQPAIEIPSPKHSESGRRVTATDIVNATAGTTNTDESSPADATQGDSNGVPANDFGTIVHRIAELRPTEDEVEAYARRVAGMLGHDLTDDDLAQIHRHARDAIGFVDERQRESEVQATYDELSVTVDVGGSTIVGDIDHLTVTQDAYLVTDYKTNSTSWRSPQELAEHYRPQMLCYALALHQHDPNREIRTALRFTDAGVTQEFRWSPNEMGEVRAELQSMLTQFESD